MAGMFMMWVSASTVQLNCLAVLVPVLSGANPKPKPQNFFK